MAAYYVAVFSLLSVNHSAARGLNVWSMSIILTYIIDGSIH